jgi:hypothetical protein
VVGTGINGAADEEVAGSRGTGPGGYAVHRLVGASGLDEARRRRSQEILRPGGGGDSFASGLIYGLPATGNLQTALSAAPHTGALDLTTPGDTSMASLAEVEGRPSPETQRGARVQILLSAAKVPARAVI